MRSTLLLAIALVAPLAAAQTADFTRVAVDLPLQGTAALWTDYDGDGETDLFFANGQDDSSLFVRDNPGPFVRQTISLSNAQHTDGVFADIDGDGDRDYLRGSLSSSVYFRREGSGFVAANLPGFSGLSEVRTVEAVDVDGDGRLDVLAGTRTGPTVLLLNTLTGWEPAADDLAQDQSTTASVCWGDADDDGDLDLYMTTSAGEPNRAFRNDGGAFAAWDLGIDEDASEATTSCSWGDADGDGDLDLFTTAANGGRSRLYLNDGATLTLAPTSVFPDLRADLFNATWGDVDNDGDLDLVVVGRDEPQRVFYSLAGRFREVRTILSPGAFNVAVALLDFDADGDLDAAVATGDANVREANTILENRLDASNGWLGVRLVGTQSNREGVGAAVTVYASSGDQTLQLRQTVLAHTSRRTQADTRLHFGLGDTSVDSVVVRWPTGVREVYEDVEGGEVVALVETDGALASEPGLPTSEATLSLDVWPNPARGAVSVRVSSAVSGAALVEVFDVRGRRVWSGSQPLAAGELATLSVEADEWAPGVYAVRVRTGSAVVSTRITLTRR